MELKSTKDIISSLKEMLRGSKQTEDLKDIAAQTDENSNKKDVEVQVSRPGFTLSEIKKEPQVAIPNRPSSIGPTLSKKRKIASTQIQRKMKARTRPLDDVSILNPQLYKAYCSQSDPNEAREAIRKMRNCSKVTTLKAVVVETEISDEESNVRDEVRNAVSYLIDGPMIDDPSDGYWPSAEKPSIENLKSIIEDYVCWYQEEHRTDLVIVNMLTITGIEIWVVEDFDKGPKESKWFRKIFKLMLIQYKLYSHCTSYK